MITLMHGDCLERMKEIPDGSVDMVLADPPYGTTACKWDTVIDLEKMWKQLKRVVKPNGAIVMTASQPFTTTLIASNMQGYSHSWIWVKTRATGYQRSNREPLRITEDVVVFYNQEHINQRNSQEEIFKFKELLKKEVELSGMTRKQLNDKCGFDASSYLRTSSSWSDVLPPKNKFEKIKEILNLDKDLQTPEEGKIKRTYNPQGVIKIEKRNKRSSCGAAWSELKSNDYIQNFSNYPCNLICEPSIKGLHPTQKPVALMEYLIKTYTNEGDTVLDFTMGSGSTGVACLNTGRNFIGIELDPDYFEIATKRIEESK